MRSYEAARSYFSFLGFLSWCVIILGGIVAIGALIAMGQMSRSFGGSPMAGLAGIIPGIAIMFAGFMGLVLVQIGRAGVDSAEYAQQGLQISREQLEISRQRLKQGAIREQGYAALQAAKEDLKSSSEPPAAASHADATTAREPKETLRNDTDKSIATTTSPEPEEELSEESYNGPWRIEEKYGRFYAKGQVFQSKKEAVAYLRHAECATAASAKQAETGPS